MRTGYVGTESIGDVLTKANFDKLGSLLVGYVTSTSNSGPISTVTTYPTMTLTITAATSRMYLIIIGAHSAIQVGTGASSMQIWDGTGSTVLQTANFSSGAAAAATYPGTNTMILHQPSAGSQTYAFRLLSTATSISAQAGAINPAYLYVFDVAPSF